MSDYDQISEKARQHWGDETQVHIAIGEMGEAIAALTRYCVQGRGSLESVQDELADAGLVLNTLELIFGRREIHQRRLAKSHRLLGIIEGRIDHPHKGAEQ